MRTTFRLFAAACLLSATLGCQPEADPQAIDEFDVELGETETPAVTTESNITAVGEFPDSNVTGVFEVPEPTETPLTTTETPVAPQATTAPEVSDTPTVTEVEPTEPVQTEPEAADADEAAPQPVE